MHKLHRTHPVNDVQVQADNSAYGSNDEHEEEELDAVCIQVKAVVLGVENGSNQLTVRSVCSRSHHQSQHLTDKQDIV